MTKRTNPEGAGFAQGPTCPTPEPETERIQLGHGSGGRMSRDLLRDRFLPAFRNQILEGLGDGSVVPLEGGEIVVSTDSFVVAPLEFPGGNIGDLAVNGTINDLAMMGAEPRYLTAGFILEEGLPFQLLDRVLESMAQAARAAGVLVVAGDTKVVERGKADGLYINTTGIGRVLPDFRPGPHRAEPGDAVLVSGPLGRHGITVLAARGELELRVDLESDTAPLHGLVAALREGAGSAVHVLRDPTRGGLASTLNEVATASGVGIEVDETTLPIPGPVQGACELLGLDPLYVANEGLLVAVVAGERAGRVLEILRGHPLGRGAAVIGRVTSDHRGMVVMRTPLGGTRVVDLLPGDQLPRIC
ncbi:MAG: hydrogenase expression/formation protein HypE [Longimicrobiales bacterium]|nr:hydrogenase expression/formation protein HypE [Longimicrobiales bacterium]